MKLHIGCGTRKLYGYTSVDIRPEAKPDILDDVMLKGREFKNCQEIYACMVLEHLPREKVHWVLCRWHEILTSNGMLRLSVPDFRAASEYYLSDKHGRLSDIENLLMGREDHSHNFHHSLWDRNKLEGALYRAGFHDVKGWDWKRFYHFSPGYDDFASAYLPDFCKTSGQLMSLNLMGFKPE